MLLRPRKFSYKNIQKNRKKTIAQSPILKFGQLGIYNKQTIFLTSHKLFRLKLFLKKATRKSDKTKRLFWLNLFPHLPLSKKVLGSRMGKGKGKQYTWFTEVPAGTVIISFKNLRVGRFYYFFTQIEFKLKSKLNFFFKKKLSVNLGFNSSYKITYQTFW